MRFLLHRYSLRTTLLTFVIIPVTALALGAGWAALAGLERQVERRLQEEIELVARAIRLPLSDALERERTGSLQFALDSAFQIDRVYGAYVYDADGDLVAASGPFDPRVTSREEARRVTETGSHGEFAARGGEEVFSYFVPLSDTAGRIIGLLQVTRHGNDFRSYLARLRSGSFPLFLGGILVLCVVVVFGHDRAVGRWLRGIGADMERIRGGERGHRVAEQGPREIRRLTQSMNTMLDAIDSSERELKSNREVKKRLEERLAQAEKMAAIGQLSAGVAHELGTPLNIVDGHAQRLGRGLDPDRPGVRSVATIRSEVRRMERIVRQLMDIGRRNPLDLKRYRAERLARGAAARLAGRVDTSSVTFRVGGSPADLELTVDQARLEQALVNLLANAVQASPQGTVAIEWFVDGASAGFRIDDDGPGVPQDERRQMFEPFFTTKHTGKGTGLGLAVAHGAVADHEGEIQATDSPLGGMRFVILIPATVDDR